MSYPVRLRLWGPPTDDGDAWGRQHEEHGEPAGGPYVVHATAEEDPSGAADSLTVTFNGETHVVPVDDLLTAPMTCRPAKEVPRSELRQLRARLAAVAGDSKESALVRQSARAALRCLHPQGRRNVMAQLLDVAAPAGQHAYTDEQRSVALALLAAVVVAETT